MPLFADSAIAHSASGLAQEHRAKRVILSCGVGSLGEVLSVTLQIGPEGRAPTSEIVARLEPDGELEQCFQVWNRCYSSLGGSGGPLGIQKTADEPRPSHSTMSNCIAC